jgi:hypothetical protein
MTGFLVTRWRKFATTEKTMVRSSENICSRSGGAQEKGKRGK